MTISGYKLEDKRQCLGRWNTVVQNMNKQCNEMGPTQCMIVYYEQLVLHPKKWVQLILDFLDLPWDENCLHHEQNINKPGAGGVRVSKVERSSDQIIKPINVDALTTWVGFYDEDILEDMDAIAPMLRNSAANRLIGEVTPRYLNVKLGPRRKSHKGQVVWLA